MSWKLGWKRLSEVFRLSLHYGTEESLLDDQNRPPPSSSSSSGSSPKESHNNKNNNNGHDLGFRIDLVWNASDDEVQVALRLQSQIMIALPLPQDTVVIKLSENDNDGDGVRNSVCLRMEVVKQRDPLRAVVMSRIGGSGQQCDGMGVLAKLLKSDFAPHESGSGGVGVKTICADHWMNVTVVSLCRCGLSTFPVELTKLPLLEKLYLDNNKLLVLPPEVGDLKNLKVLAVDYNILVTVPVELRRCVGLVELSLEHNKLVCPLLDFRAMAELRVLRLFGNPLEFLPEILPLHQLRHLSLANIRIVADDYLRSVNVQIEMENNSYFVASRHKLSAFFALIFRYSSCHHPLLASALAKIAQDEGNRIVIGKDENAVRQLISMISSENHHVVEQACSALTSLASDVSVSLQLMKCDIMQPIKRVLICNGPQELKSVLQVVAKMGFVSDIVAQKMMNKDVIRSLKLLCVHKDPEAKVTLVRRFRKGHVGGYFNRHVSWFGANMELLGNHAVAKNVGNCDLSEGHEGITHRVSQLQIHEVSPTPVMNSIDKSKKIMKAGTGKCNYCIAMAPKHDGLLDVCCERARKRREVEAKTPPNTPGLYVTPCCRLAAPWKLTKKKQTPGLEITAHSLTSTSAQRKFWPHPGHHLKTHQEDQVSLAPSIKTLYLQRSAYTEEKAYQSRVQRSALLAIGNLAFCLENRQILVASESLRDLLLRHTVASELRVRKAAARALAILGENESLMRSIKGRQVAKQGLRILTMDGGGMKGLATVQILKEIEKGTGKLVFAEHVPKDNEAATWREKFDQLYKSSSQSYRVVVHGSKHSADEFERLLKEICAEEDGDLLIDSAVKGIPKVIVISTLVNVAPAQPFIFRNYQYPAGTLEAPSTISSNSESVTSTNGAPIGYKHGTHMGSCRHHIWQAIRASSAAPYYLDDYSDGVYRWQDGAIVANNPTIFAIREARILWPDAKIDTLVSIGCCTVPTKVRKGGWRYLDTGQVLVESACSTDRIEDMLSTLLSMIPDIQYFRFNPVDERCDMELDETDPTIWLKLEAATNDYIKNNSLAFRNVCEKLSQNHNNENFSDNLPTQQALKAKRPSIGMICIILGTRP
ncbi:hypothetical protein SSX86_022803 [Deinandra increscens subsp. villosa]|uniref:Patatin n=1 Tax=Deinandra increscens subsp. villosa TaxID=3103831 RepID=A0AAP0CNU9_9ASTR